jgi:hypothetical protein
MGGVFHARFGFVLDSERYDRMGFEDYEKISPEQGSS